MNNGVIYKNTKDNRKPLLAIIIILLLVIIGCSIYLLKSDKKQSNEEYSRTIMIYMVGSNLESEGYMGTGDIESLNINGLKDKKVNVVVMAGGSKKWHNNYIDPNESSIYEINENGVVKVKQQPKKNMGEASSFTDFLSYVYDNYKTDKYDLLLWNHGGGIFGSEYDELYDNDNLSLVEFDDAFSKSPFNGNNKIELVFFETCLNSTIEVASIFQKYAEYMVASEEITLGTKKYGMFQFINNLKPNDSPVDIGRKFIDTYRESVMAVIESNKKITPDMIYSTYSVIDLSGIQELTTSVNDFFGTVNKNYDYNKVSKIRTIVRGYGSDIGKPSSESDFDLIDLYNLIDKMREFNPEKADKVINAFNNTVLYNYATNPESRGLSIYFPYYGASKYYSLNIYKNLKSLQDYNQFISDFNNKKNSGYSSEYTFSKNIVNVQNDTNNNLSDFEIEISDEQLEKLAYTKYYVFRDNKDGYYKPIYMNGYAQLDGNKLKASIKNKQLRIESKNPSEGGYTLILNEVENTNDYIEYAIYVVLHKFGDDITEWKTDSATILLKYDKTTGDVDIINTVLDSDLPEGISVDLNDYDSIAFSLSSGWSITNSNGQYIGPHYDDAGKLVGDGVVTGYEAGPNDYTIGVENFDDDYDYYCVFAMYDTYGNVSFTNLVKMN